MIGPNIIKVYECVAMIKIIGIYNKDNMLR